MSSPNLAPQMVDVPLDLFGGTDTELAPSDLPEGLSPDNQDVIFIPGEVDSRPGLSKLFNTPFLSGTGSVLYQKSYVQPNGNPLNLYLTSDGSLWVEDVGLTPGVYGQIGTVPKHLYGQSVSAFGREYIAFSDLLRGQGVPLQYDGTNLDRVTQDGPGAPPQVSDYIPSFVIAAAGVPGLTIFTETNSVTGTEVGHLVTLVYPAPYASKPVVGDIVTVTGMTVAGYNGTFTLTAVTNSTLQYINPIGSLAADPSGTGSAAISFVEVTTTTANIFVAGNAITVQGAGVAGYNTNYVVRRLFSSTQFICQATAAQAALANSGGGTVSLSSTPTGQITVGTHQIVVMFLTRQGYLTRPSPAFSYTSAGTVQALAANLPIGSSNVVARVLGMTGAGGANFFTQVVAPQIGGVVVGTSLLIPDNTSTQAVFSIADNTLFSGIPIDVIGNDLFDQFVLGTPMGFFSFASRLMTWGDWNKIENFLAMGFGGGILSGVPTQPLGWSVDTAGGTLVTGGSWASGRSWQITGDGSGNAKGRLTQSAYQDSFGNAILSPSTLYIARLWASGTALTGNIIVDLFDTGSSTVLAIATIAASQVNTIGQFLQATFNTATPATIPPGTVLRISETGMANATTVTLGELQIIFAVNPYRNTLSQVSYGLNPEAFALTTGNLGAADDDSPMQNFTLQRNVGLLHTSEATHEFQDNAYEPGDGDNSWPVNSLTHSVGSLSLKGCDPGKFGSGDSAEDWDIIASKNGVYIHTGAQFYKVAQEMSRTLDTAPNAVTWDDINWTAQQTIWIKNVVNKRYALIGVPVGEVLVPNIVFVLDYREMDTAQQIAGALPIHITLAGKMKSSDLTRKWTRWNVKASCAEVLVRPNNAKELFLGGGSGSTVGGQAFGNVYSLDPTKLTDDDYGQIAPYYYTYFWVDNDQAQALQLGSARRIYKHISADISGVGYVQITPFINSLLNPQPPISPRLLSQDTTVLNSSGNDLEWTTSTRGQRVAFKIEVLPAPGSTNVQMKLQKLIVWLMKDPVSLFRSSGV